MKNIHRLFIGLLAILFITSSTIKPKDRKRLFEKIVFMEITPDEDSALFLPLSEAWTTNWQLNSDLQFKGSDLMNYANYKSAFEKRADNLWTILHPLIINGTIPSYYPSNPELFGLGPDDDGELRYPILRENETFFNSEEVTFGFCNVLGKFGASYDVPMVDEFGEYIIRTDENGFDSFVYPPSNYTWHQDKDIVKYMVRVSVLVNEKGVEKQRTIKAISPMIRNHIDGVEKGEKAMIWLNFEELAPYLSTVSYLNEKSKSVSYLDYFLRKLKETDFRK